MLLFLLACSSAPAPAPAPVAAPAREAATAPARAATLLRIVQTAAEQGPNGEPPTLTIRIEAGAGNRFERTMQSTGEGQAGIDGALWGVNTWWAGGGTNLRVVRDGDSVAIRTQEVDEGQTSEAPWKEEARFNVGPGAITLDVK